MILPLFVLRPPADEGRPPPRTVKVTIGWKLLNDLLSLDPNAKIGLWTADEAGQRISLGKGVVRNFSRLNAEGCSHTLDSSANPHELDVSDHNWDVDTLVAIELEGVPTQAPEWDGDQVYCAVVS